MHSKWKIVVSDDSIKFAIITHSHLASFLEFVVEKSLQLSTGDGFINFFSVLEITLTQYCMYPSTNALLEVFFLFSGDSIIYFLFILCISNI